MVTRKNLAQRMAEQLAKLEAQYPKRSRGPLTYTDQEIINLAQDYARMKTEPAPPPPKRKRVTGKWWEIGTLGQDEVTEHQSNRLQYYFDLASEPNPRVNYWVLYFNELARYGGENWDSDDWRKWRIWYFSMHPEQRAVYRQDQASRRQRNAKRRWRNMTQEQKDRRNEQRRKAYREKRQGQ